MPADKEPGALLTIGELSHQRSVPQHILRYWETRFSQLKPMQRAGNRRYYRPADVDLVRRINRLLNEEGYTVRGVQKVLRGRAGNGEDAPQQSPQPLAESGPMDAPEAARLDVGRLVAIRDSLASALYD